MAVDEILHTAAAALLGQGIPTQNNVFSPSDQFLIWPVQPSPRHLGPSNYGGLLTAAFPQETI